MRNLGRVLAVANPAARGGQGARIAAYLRSASARLLPGRSSLTLEVTAAPGHAAQLAAQAAGFDTLLVIGGDGVVHEAAGGLMRLSAEQRPVLGVIPCGNGNDYARTLGMPLDARRALHAISRARVKTVDAGEVNGRVFVETLSFGLDAAIALGTRARRERTGARGTRLYLEEGLSQLARHRDEYPYRLSLDGAPSVRASMLLFAVQVGPTYGGGFRICPGADASDGAFDVCIAHPPLGFLAATSLFLRAKGGGHTGRSDVLEFSRAERLVLDFEAPPPVQVDGEPLGGVHFDVRTIPGALDVLCIERG